MKKIIILLLLLLTLIGCTKEDKKNNIEEYYFKYNETDIKVNTLFNTVSFYIGEYNDERIEEDHHIYEYNSFEIETYLDNNNEKIFSIVFTNNEVTTIEGLRIGDSLEKIINVYGKDYIKENNQIIYTSQNTKITFILENDIIEEIRYHM